MTSEVMQLQERLRQHKNRLEESIKEQVLIRRALAHAEKSYRAMKWCAELNDRNVAEEKLAVHRLKALLKTKNTGGLK